MKELKFRAIIPERNATIYFTLKDLIQDKFSNREILWKWLKEGNQPDLFTGFKDHDRKEIYEGDIVKKSYHNGFCYLLIERFNYKPVAKILKNLPYEYVIGYENFGNDYLYYDLYQLEGYNLEVIGNIYENPELLKE